MLRNNTADREVREQIARPPAVVGRWSRIARRVLRPQVVIPATFSVALLATLLGVGNARKILTDLSTFQPRYVAWYALVMALYMCGRGILWHVLVRSLHAAVPLRSQAMAFLAGEVTKSLPLGNYFPNYLLRRSTHAAFGLTSTATLAITLLEVSVSLTIVAALGLGGWTPWLRPLILIGAPVCLLIGWGIYLMRGAIAPLWDAGRRRYAALRTLDGELRQARAGASYLWQPRVLLVGLLLCAFYVAMAGIGLYLIARGLGLDTLSIQEALSVHSFSLAFALIEPSPMDLGVIEAGGVGALLAVSAPIDLAISMMLIQRVLNTGVSLVIAGAGMVVLRRELRAAMRAQPE